MRRIELEDFVVAQLPPPPARVLDVGCGAGELSLALDRRGYDVVAVDPVAPEGTIFRRVALEDFDDDRGFDAAFAGRSLHHVHDLGAALDKLARLAPLLVLDEFAWDRLDERTADWYEAQRRMVVASGGSADPLGDWEDEHADLHGYDVLRRELDRRYDERHFEWTPYLFHYLGGVATEELERSLVAAGAINGLGFRYAGVRATTRSSGAER